MGKGGSSTSVQIPEWLETAAKRNLGQADKISRVGPVPLSYGPTAAAFTDSQIAGFNNNANTASAFGLNAPGAYSMGTPTEYANGVRAYSAAPLYNQTMDAFAAERPGQKSYIDSFFIDPFTGGVGSNVAPLVNYDNYQTAAEAAAQQQANDLAIAQANSGPQVISTVNVDQQTGNFGQDNQIYNPDINYDDAYVASNNQVVGTLDPSQTSLNNMSDTYGIDSDFYTDDENPIYSASDFELGSSTTGTNYTDYDTTDDNSTTVMNDSGSIVSTGYDVGEVDPGLAEAAGYTTPAYDGSSEKNAQVAAILKDQYGWSDQQLIDGGYEGYAAEPEPTLGDTISDAIASSPTVQILDNIFNPDVTTDVDLFETTYDAASADAANNPTGTTQPAVYNDNDDDDNVEFANTVLGSDDITTFLPPSNNDDDGPQGIVGNNDTGSNSIAQSIANSLTPNDGMEYVDGVLVNTGATVNAMQNDNDSSNDDPGGGDDKIVCTEMYRQTQLDDWVMAMKTWYVYQRKHLTPYHQVGYHAVFRPFVKGMRRSTIITNIGAYAATERTKHLRHVLTKGKSEDSLFGRILCKVMEPPLYVVGRVVSALRKDA